jgi:hypothetical protein
VSQNAEDIEIVIVRTDGSDGRISCNINTMMLTKSSSSAREFDHFFPVSDKLVFNHNDSETRYKIRLIPKQKQNIEKGEVSKGMDDEGNLPESDESEEEENDL